MKNFVQRGDSVTMIAPTGGTVSGRGVLIGQMFGVALDTVAQTLPFEMLLEGVVEIAKLSALAFAPGDVAYWDDTNKQVNATSAAQKEVGIVIATAANPSATCLVKLYGMPRTSVAA